MASLLIAIFLVLALASCRPKNQVNRRLADEMPRRVLWAWERPEDLLFIDANEYGVAFLAQTVFLEEDRVIPKARRQPLAVPDGAYVIAVTRIETNKETAKRPKMTSEMAEKIAALIRGTTDLPNVRALQIDFDAVSSEREFYRMLIREVRQQAPGGMPLTMTSLASWCTGDAWFNDFPVDEAVPMAFRMGADEEKVRTYLRNGNDWREPLCRGSYGLSVDDPPVDGIKPGRRIYLFSNGPWTTQKLDEVPNRVPGV